MLPRFENAAAAMNELRRQQVRIANNLANADTTGYKRDRFFVEVLNERIDAQGHPRSNRQIRQGSDFSGGALEETGNPLDVALGGDGFFVVQEEGTGANRYTRAGHFVVGNEGTLRTPGGKAVVGEGGPIQVPVDSGGSITIAENGEITVGDEEVGRLRVVQFENRQQLERAQGAAFTAGNMRPEPVENPQVLQGKIETSNVDPVSEMTDMIEHYRQFEAQQRMMRTTGEAMRTATQSLGQF